MPDSPFNILQLINGNTTATNGMVTVVSETPCIMRRRRSLKPGRGITCEMLYAQLMDGTRIYIRQTDGGAVNIRITNRDIYV